MAFKVVKIGLVDSALAAQLQGRLQIPGLDMSPIGSLAEGANHCGIWERNKYVFHGLEPLYQENRAIVNIINY